MADDGRPTRKFPSGINKTIGRANLRLVEQVVGAEPGVACDVSMGPGHNVRFLSLNGWRVLGIESSEVALIHAERQLTNCSGAQLIHADITRPCLKLGRFDLVICTYYMDRAIFPWLRTLLRPGGRIFFESYDTNHLRYVPDFPKEDCVRDGEPAKLFAGLKITSLRRIDSGTASVQSVVASKP